MRAYCVYAKPLRPTKKEKRNKKRFLKMEILSFKKVIRRIYKKGIGISSNRFFKKVICISEKRNFKKSIFFGFYQRFITKHLQNCQPKGMKLKTELNTII